MRRAPWPIPVLAASAITFGIARLCVAWLALATMPHRNRPWISDTGHLLWEGQTWISLIVGLFSLIAAWRVLGKDSVSWTAAIGLVLIAVLAVLTRISMMA
jgi:hypothetical protein